MFLTNGVGIQSVNNQLQADHFAKEGYLVVMPDLCVSSCPWNEDALG